MAVFILLGLETWSYFLSSGDAEGRAFAFSLLAGAAFGIVLQRGRFCFFCNFRDLVENRRADGVISILVALAAGTLFYQIVIIAWMPVPLETRLPPTAHIGPVGPALAVAALVFGLGMALSGSCLSAHFYRLGEGAFGSIAALAGAVVGFFIGFLSWNSLYTLTVFDDPAVWLPQYVGYAGALIVTLGLLFGLVILVLFYGSRGHDAQEKGDPVRRTGLGPGLDAVLLQRWPPVVTGVLVATISAFAYFRVAPLGVTAEFGSLVRTAGTQAGWLPETLAGLDTVRGCISALKTTVLSRNGLFVLGLGLASFASALSAGQFRPSWPSWRGIAARFVGGAMMGWGSMTALGCTVGVLLSGIHAGALSGWLFLLFCSLGIWSGLRLQKLLERYGP